MTLEIHFQNVCKLAVMLSGLSLNVSILCDLAKNSSFSPVAFVFLMSLGAVMGLVRASRTLHNSLLSNILKVPLSFFDTTPKGRILNRFTKDIDSLDDQLRLYLLLFLLQMSSILSTITAIIYSTPIFAVVALGLAGLFSCLQVGHYNDVMWQSWLPGSRVTQLFFEQLVRINNEESAKPPHYWPLMRRVVECLDSPHNRTVISLLWRHHAYWSW